MYPNLKHVASLLSGEFMPLNNPHVENAIGYRHGIIPSDAMLQASKHPSPFKIQNDVFSNNFMTKEEYENLMHVSLKMLLNDT